MCADGRHPTDGLESVRTDKIYIRYCIRHKRFDLRKIKRQHCIRDQQIEKLQMKWKSTDTRVGTYQVFVIRNVCHNLIACV